METQESTAWFTVQCWGCNKAVTRPYSGHDDAQHKIELLQMGGWRRREFGPNASPWFCSEDCAMNSYNAKQAEEWWAKHKFRQENDARIIPIQFWPILIFAGVLTLGALISSWCN